MDLLAVVDIYGSFVLEFVGLLVVVYIGCKSIPILRGKQKFACIYKIVFFGAITQYTVFILLCIGASICKYFGEMNKFFIIQGIFTIFYAWTLYTLIDGLIFRAFFTFRVTMYRINGYQLFVIYIFIFSSCILTLIAEVLIIIQKEFNRLASLLLFIGIILYFIVSWAVVIMFISRLHKLIHKRLNTNLQISENDTHLVMVSSKIITLASIGLTSSLIVSLYIILSPNKNMVSIYLLDMIINIICIYLTYTIGNNDYKRYCKLCDNIIQGLFRKIVTGVNRRRSFPKPVFQSTPNSVVLSQSKTVCEDAPLSVNSPTMSPPNISPQTSTPVSP